MGLLSWIRDAFDSTKKCDRCGEKDFYSNLIPRLMHEPYNYFTTDYFCSDCYDKIVSPFKIDCPICDEGVVYKSDWEEHLRKTKQDGTQEQKESEDTKDSLTHAEVREQVEDNIRYANAMDLPTPPPPPSASSKPSDEENSSPEPDAVDLYNCNGLVECSCGHHPKINIRKDFTNTKRAEAHCRTCGAFGPTKSKDIYGEGFKRAAARAWNELRLKSVYSDIYKFPMHI